MTDMDTCIASLASVRLHSSSRVLRSASCPDKDLVVLITNDGVTEKMSLWKIQGSKKWEVDIVLDDGVKDEITALAWSPDGTPTQFHEESPLVLSCHL